LKARLTSRREFLGSLALGALAPGLLARSTRADGARRPNVLVVLADDLGWADLSCHGHPILRTPHLDRLHSQSTRLTDFHVSPTCSPTRAALLTGLHEFRCGVTHTTEGRHVLRSGLPTLPELMVATGYQTALFGKWHLGDNRPLTPEERGFQHALWHGGGIIGATPDWWGNTYFDPVLRSNGAWKKHRGYSADIFFSEAANWIEVTRTKPFFCLVAPNTPHVPNQVEDAYAAPYRNHGVDPETAKYYGMIANLDENIGRLLARIEACDLTRDTIVIFLSDNGPVQGLRYFTGGLKGAKKTVDENGTRAPCFIRWPGRLGAGRNITALTAHFDLLPTLADLCGFASPSNLDGRSLAPHLLDGAEGWTDDRLLFHHLGRWPSGSDLAVAGRQDCAVRSARWRLVDHTALFDLSKDPGQTTDVAAKYPDIVTGLRLRYDSWWASLGTSLSQIQSLCIGHDQKPETLTCQDWRRSLQFPDEPLMPVAEQARLTAFVQRPPHGALGGWPVEVRAAGRYEFRLSLRPAEAPVDVRRLNPGTAHLRCGERVTSEVITAGSTEAVFRLDLAAGSTWLEGWLDGQRPDGKPAGAYYTTVSRLT
jgi:arylsulfatase A-like enzyme